ncbi:MAG: DNA recombination/repair protein RecA, partial [Candidatus Shapirobacteria bacterium]|nr:DNA recombination/repair protein RecA [Candidatus Shapirobacteria bacterium]
KKNKVAPPFREAEFDIMNKNGISLSGDVLDLGVGLGLIEKSGAFYKRNSQVLAQGREAAKKYLENNSKVMEEIISAIKKTSHKD